MTVRSKGRPKSSKQSVDPCTGARPVVFGELLFDCFPDHQRVLGGAPFNVAWHLQGMGLSPLLVTRIGADEAGREALDAMASWGMETRGVQVDQRRSTGSVDVRLDDGEPRFHIRANQAWDHIDRGTCEQAIGDCSASFLYHGTLALRSDESRTALIACRSATGASFVDLNLRSPWWSAEIIGTAVRGAAWVKLNHAELEEVAEGANDGSAADAAAAFRSEHRLDGVVVTLGADGAVAVAEETAIARPEDVSTEGDTVGAGDAFSSVCLAGLLARRPLQEILDRAIVLASQVCRVRGALIHDRSVYTRLVGDWM